jgi:acyl-CoA synthetase (NDP forming)
MRLIGPNCLGVMNPLIGLNATFSQAIARSGNVAFLSQSGALLTAILDWSLREEFGFSAFVSTGSMLDVGWGDLIDYFGNDPNTKSILIYMESVGALKGVRGRKPINMKALEGILVRFSYIPVELPQFDHGRTAFRGCGLVRAILA